MITIAALVHVAVDKPVSIVDSELARSGVIVTALAAAVSLLLGLLSLWLTFRNDRLQRERVRPYCGMSNVTFAMQTPDSIGEVVGLNLNVGNVGGGPAIKVFLELESYGGIEPLDKRAYVGIISPGVDKRPQEHTFHLPPRPGKPYTDNEPYALALHWRGLFSEEPRESYIGPDPKRRRE